MTATESLRATEVEQHLWVCAREVVGDQNAEFSVPCSHNVKDFIRAGVRNMLREGRISDLDLEEAGKNLTTLVLGMVNSPMGVETRKISGSNREKMLREGSLVVAKRLCPLWPFS